jgi:C-5 cytosine-specific DNA methylase
MTENRTPDADTVRLLDLFCGAGGAAMGYHLAGFEIVGVDIDPQPNYPFDFVAADAMTFPLDGFDAIHASPPCQHYAPVTRWRGDAGNHPDLLEATVARLRASGLPWVVENVPYAPLRPDFVLCGSMFGLQVRRHRWFLTSWAGFELVQGCHHDRLLPFEHKGERAYADAMGCQWMTNREAREAIPPAYTDWIGRRLLATLEAAA